MTTLAAVPMEGVTWGQWLSQAPSRVRNIMATTHRFSTSSGSVAVTEQRVIVSTGSALCVSGGKPGGADVALNRIRSRDETGAEFDLRRLQAGAEAGGLVTLAALNGLDLEVDLMTSTEPNVHLLRVHSQIVQNGGTSHCRLLLCEPCDVDLATHFLSKGTSGLLVTEIAEIGRQLAVGLGHLHGFDVLCGTLTPWSIFQGQDGFWKLGDFQRGARLPLSVGEWSEQRAGKDLFGGVEGSPPETRGSSDVSMTVQVDIWLLGQLLASLVSVAGIPAFAGGGPILAAPPVVFLADPVQAHLWLMIHWLRAAQPASRPRAGECAALLSSLAFISAEELYEDLPQEIYLHCTAVTTNIARQCAMDAIAAASEKTQDRMSTLDRLVGYSLAELRKELSDPETFDRLCTNCGIAMKTVDKEEDASVLEYTSTKAGSATMSEPTEAGSATMSDEESVDSSGGSADRRDAKLPESIPDLIELGLPDLITF